MTADLAITLVAAFGIAFLGFIVYFHDRKSASNIIFSLISLVTVFWAIANYFSLNVEAERVLFWIRLVLFFAAPHAVLFLVFAYNFPNVKIVLNKSLLVFLLILLFVTMLTTVSPFVFSNAEIDGNQVTPLPGPLMPLFAIVVIGSLASGIYLITRRYIKAKAFERAQWRLMIIGVALSYLFLIITNFILVVFFRNTSFIIFGPVYMLPTFIGMSYAILRHHLLNVKTIATEILTFVILSVSLFEIFISQSKTELLFRISAFTLFLFFGLLLIRSVLREVEQRERMERMTAELEHVNERLKELDHLKSEFLNFASHQVKSPMATVKGFATLIEDGTYGQVSDQAKEGAHRIKGAADRLISLVNNLLDLGKIESGKLDFTMQEMDIVKLLATMVDEFQVLAQNKKLALTFETDKPSLVIKADAEKLRQVVQNLIDNAIKYTDHGYVRVTVEVQSSKSKVQNGGSDSILITVADSGRGMSPELLQKLFGRFVRDEKTKTEVMGTGLGLYIAKEIVKAHHGEIWAESDGIGRGSKFYVRIQKS